VQGRGGDVLASLSPGGADGEELVHEAIATPEGKRGAGDFSYRYRRGVVLQIDAGSGAIVRAGAVDHPRIAPTAPDIPRQGRIEIGKLGSAPANQASLVEEVRIGRDQPLGKASSARPDQRPMARTA